MSKLTVLHLSDAHWSEAKDHSERVLIDRLLDDLGVMKARNVVPDIVVFSGDLVQAGEDKNAFSRAYDALLKPICELLDLSEDRIFVCPGNHDVSRKTARDQALLEEGLKGSLISEEALNQFIRRAHAGAPMERMALDRLTNFYDWHDAHFPDFIAASQFCRLKTITVAGKQIAVCLMNSAWRATGESGNVDEGHLILGSIFAEKAIERIKDCQYKIAVFHHPFETHAEFDRVLTEPRIAKNFDLICTGHNHRPRPERIEDIYGSSIRSQSGSLYAGSRWFNGYQIIEIDFVKDVTSIYCRECYGVRDEFDAAKNLTNADPLQFNFAVRSKDAGDQIELFLDGNREIVRKTLIDHLNFTNSEHINNGSIIDGFACPKLFTRGEGTINESGSFSDTFQKITLDDIFSRSEGVLFHGPRQSGKTSLKLYCAYRFAFGLNCAPKIPIFIDLATFTFNLYGLQKALNATYQVPAKFELSPAVEAGSFVFLFEDAGQLDESGLKRLSEFIANYKPNRSMVFACPDESSVAKERHFKKFLPELLPVGLGELTRSSIRKMTQCWFEESAEAKSKFELVIGQINRDGLPRTAYIVSLLLWAAKQGQQGDRLNEAILLQNVLDHLLDRANFRTAKRGALTTKGKELLLTRIANCLDERGDFARSVEVIDLVDRYFQQKKLSHDASEVVAELVNCGILRRQEGQISFRYKCFQEYYIALGMLDHAELVNKAEGRKFLTRPREVELLSGLKGENDWLIQNILEVLDASMPRDLAAVSYEDFEKQAYNGKNIFVNRERLREIKRTRLTEEQIDQVMDAIDERATSRGDRPITETLEDTGGDFVQAAHVRQADAVKNDLEQDSEFFRPATFMAGLSILARVIRNSDYTDYDVKGPALRNLLEQWCRIHVLLTGEARWILERFEEKEESPLASEDFETLVRIVSKMLFGAVGGGVVSEVSTPSLLETLNELERQGDLVTGKRLLSLFLFEDADDPAWSEKWKAVIDDSNAAAFDIDVLIDRLWSAVNRKALDADQDRRVIKVVDAVEAKFDWGNTQKSQVLEGIRDLTNLKRIREE